MIGDDRHKKGLVIHQSFFLLTSLATLDFFTDSTINSWHMTFLIKVFLWANKPHLAPKSKIQSCGNFQWIILCIIGNEGEHDSLKHEVILILSEIFPDFDPASILVKPSKTGRFHSLRLKLHLTSAEQVNRLYTALDKAKTVRTVVWCHD